MRWRDLTSAAAVHAAVAEYEDNKNKFWDKYPFKPSRRYELFMPSGRTYPSKAIVAAALNHQFPGQRILGPADFHGGEDTVVPLLRNLGFEIRDREVPGVPPVRAVVFQDAEKDYLDWLNDHPDSLVLNSRRRPSPKYLPLHRARCATIAKSRPNMRSGAFTERGYIKVCADDHEALLEWIRSIGGETFSDYCSHCHAPRMPVAQLLQGTRDAQLQRAVAASRDDSARARAERLRRANPKPEPIAVIRLDYRRNPDVIAETLIRANGNCGCCHREAPFARATDGTPFLEVHHRIPLSEGGDDTVENAIALCPNCHRWMHHGLRDAPP